MFFSLAFLESINNAIPAGIMLLQALVESFYYNQIMSLSESILA